MSNDIDNSFFLFNETDEIFRKSSKLIPIKSRKPSKLIPIKPICLIENDEGSGSGFFIEIPIPLKKKPIRGLMTNNHVLNENYLKEGKSFNISISNGSKHTIEINGNDFIFTSELIDITFIELNEENIKKINPHFLKPNNENGNIKDANTSDSILIIQYPQKKLSFARGNIRKRRSFDYYHEVSTNEGSSGSPLLNKNNYVVGIHKSSIITDQYDIDSKDNVNVAVKISEVIYAIRMLYNNESFYEIKIARKSPRKLTEMEIKELEEYGIVPFEGKDKMDKSETSKYEKKILEKSLFQCNKFGNSLLFYRTNYSWYVTILSEENEFIKYNFDFLRILNWSPIISNSEILKRNISSKINERESILITWLKLTELKYLSYKKEKKKKKKKKKEIQKNIYDQCLYNYFIKYMIINK